MTKSKKMRLAAKKNNSEYKQKLHLSFPNFENDTSLYFAYHFQAVYATATRLQQGCRFFDED